jgi:prepilin-type N-terminal cleavage/methylation domain-containing protein
MPSNKKPESNKAFTLIEVMVVMAIIAVLAILIIGAITLARKSQEETKHRSNARTVQTAMEAFFTRHRVYCGTAGLSCQTMTFRSLANFLSATGLETNLVPTACDGAASNFIVPQAYARRATLPAGGGDITLTTGSITLSIADADCNDVGETITVP